MLDRLLLIHARRLYRKTMAIILLWVTRCGSVAGDHEAAENIVHLVLARTPDAPPGAKGLSLFAVPKFKVNDEGSLGGRNGVNVAGVNHKMGYRGTSNCLLSFGESEPAIGQLVGELGRGFICHVPDDE